jgi:hypothetical protein
MRRLPKPTDSNGDLFNPRAVYELCISRVRNVSLRARLRGIRDEIEQGALDYDTRAASCDLHLFPTTESVGDVSADELVSNYTTRFVPEKSPGREVYLRIRRKLPEVCPLCGIGATHTLDHYLPKALYPLLAVTPHNLYPACMWCQQARSSDAVTSPEKLTFHPYFDDFDDGIWLTAEVLDTHPAVFRFTVDRPSNWDDLKLARAQTHFLEFDLENLLATYSGDELAGIRELLRRLHAAGGSATVRDHLLEQEESVRKHCMNSWKAAFYAAAAESDWFCEGGFAFV